MRSLTLRRLSAVLLGALLLTAPTRAWSPRDELARTLTDPDPSVQFVKGQMLSSDEARAVESRLRAAPDNLSARSQLLGYAIAHRDEMPELRRVYQNQLFWLIAHHPALPLLEDRAVELSRAQDGAAAFDHARQLWEAQIAKSPRRAQILASAANFVRRDDPASAERWLRRAQSLEPGRAKWVEKLAELLEGRARDGASRRRALTEYERAARLETDAWRKSSGLEYAAKLAFDGGEWARAQADAAELLRQSARRKNGPNYGGAVHHGNLILGRLALRAGNVKQAKTYLLAAGKTPGDAGLDSFGPNMTLAKELLEKGERDIVLRYFEECAVFWKTGGPELAKWTADVKAGRIPDFGANLVY